MNPSPRASFPSFPAAEGVGIFVGIVAWDLITEGRMDVVKAALIAGACSLIWFGVRCWNSWRQNKRD